MSGEAPPPAADPARGAGWRALRRRRAVAFRPDFPGLRSSLRRSELIGSVVELFFSALAGVGRIQLGAGPPPDPPPPEILVRDAPPPPEP